jgi:mobilization protein NikA
MSARNKRIEIRVSVDELAIIKASADALGLVVGSYLRMMGLRGNAVPVSEGIAITAGVESARTNERAKKVS